MATIPRNRLLAPRLRALVASFPGSLWKDGTHKERMEYAKTRLHYYRRRDTPAFYAALFLLTSSAELWKRSANCFYRKGFEPAYAVLGGISPHDYALISAAKGLYRGVGGPATMELADPDIVDAEVFRILWWTGASPRPRPYNCAMTGAWTSAACTGSTTAPPAGAAPFSGLGSCEIYAIITRSCGRACWIWITVRGHSSAPARWDNSNKAGVWRVWRNGLPVRTGRPPPSSPMLLTTLHRK